MRWIRSRARTSATSRPGTSLATAGARAARVPCTPAAAFGACTDPGSAQRQPYAGGTGGACTRRDDSPASLGVRRTFAIGCRGDGGDARADATPAAGHARSTILRLLAIGVVAAAIGIVIGLLIPWFPPAAAKQAHTIDTLYYVLIIVTVPIFVLVTTVVLFSVWRFRMRPGEERLDGPPIHGNTRLEVIWTALPSALIASLVVYAAIVLHDIGVKKPTRSRSASTGRQWEWTFSYPGLPRRAGQADRRAPVLYLPVNRPVYFEIHSVDVIHTFYVPAFRLQEDAVPGITTSLRATPDRLGTYPVICTQLCGYGHSTMRTTLHVVTAATFTTWLAEHGYSGPDRPGGASGAHPTSSQRASTDRPRRERHDRSAPRARSAPRHPLRSRSASASPTRSCCRSARPSHYHPCSTARRSCRSR